MTTPTWTRPLKTLAIGLSVAAILLYALSFIMVIARDRACPATSPSGEYPCKTKPCLADNELWYACTCETPTATFCLEQGRNYTIWPPVVMLILLGVSSVALIVLNICLNQLYRC